MDDDDIEIINAIESVTSSNSNNFNIQFYSIETLISLIDIYNKLRQAFYSNLNI